MRTPKNTVNRAIKQAINADVDLAGDGGGDQGGAAFVRQVDGALGFGGEGVELGKFAIEEDDYRGLFVFWRNSNREHINVISINAGNGGLC